ncbi:unnamed protein product [Tuber aestivum]|uniref:WSC domain-containing protein n=1 Tax=Tuber aestivum TaxID=59557 RepID=A0A292PYQ7_9PEZI|nr:unnamed protein product [Tuber aestivum]
MDPSIIGSPQFGMMWRKKLQGNYRGWTEQIFAQALVYTPDDTQFVYVASQMNMVYKIDAKTGDILTSRNLAIPFLVSELDDCNDISFVIGSTATGVIDDKTNTWYLTTKTYRDQSDVEKGRANGRYLIHALDTRTLEEKPGYPVNIEGLIARNNPIRMFQGGIHHQRPALMQSGPYIYAGFASRISTDCVQYNFTGWIIGWNGQTGEIVERFATEGGPEDKKGGGVWMSGGGLAQDSRKSHFADSLPRYASQLSTIPVPGRQPPTALEEAAVHMAINSDGSLAVIDFCMFHFPFSRYSQALDGADKDLGTSGIALLDPTVFKSPTVARIGCIAGKSGKLYFLNLDDLGGYQMGPNKKDAVLQTTELPNSVFATAGSYPLEGGYVYVNVVQYPTFVFKFSVGPNGEPVFTQVAQSNEKTAFVLGVGHGTSTSLNGQAGTGLYWVTDIQGLNLRIYKAVPENGVLVLLKGLNVPAQIKFSRPTFGNGRAYLTTSDGHLVAVGSPVNPPMNCSSPVEFGNATIGGAVVTKTLSCKANIAVTVTGIGPRIAQYFSVSDLPTFPLALTAGQIVSFKTTFKPTAPGPLSDDIYVNTTNSIADYADNTPIAVRGVATSLTPVLFISPNTVSFAGIITGENPAGYNRAVIIQNQGSTTLTISEINVSTTSEAGPFLPPGTTAAGPFTFTGFPTTIPPESSVTVNINFNPTTEGNFGAYVQFKTNGGTKFLTVVATAGSYPKALIEFEKVDGSGWTAYQPGVPFSFGTVFEQATRTLRMRLTNFGNPSDLPLELTLSSGHTDTFGTSARNGIDLGEGTELAAGQSATAQLFCSVPKSQVNVDAYVANSTWTMNTNDPTMGKQDIVFSCDAVSEQLGPLKANSQGRYRYIGCFKENNPGRQLSNQLYGADTNENGKCMSGCAGAAQNFIFAGTQYHRECWCGNTIPSLKVGEEECNFDCSGNGTQICGGNGYFGGGSYISLFADSDRYNPGGPVSSSSTTGDPTGSPTPTPTGGPIDNPGNSNFGFAGCYTEATIGRALSVLTASDTMTVNTCLDICNTYEYAGLEYGRLSLYTKKKGPTPTGSNSSSSSATATGTTASSSVSPTPTGPIDNPGNVNYSFVGCYTEPPAGRALTLLTASDTMDVNTCLGICSTYEYAGLEYGSECWCGNSLALGAVSTDVSQCRMTCKGNPFEYCGAGNRLSLYKKNAVLTTTTSSGTTSSTSSSSSSTTTITSSTGTSTSTSSSVSPTPTGPIDNPGNANYSFVGCYAEPPTGRALSVLTGASDMTIDKCGAAQVPVTECRMKCAGNALEYCGAGQRLSLYKKKDLISSSSSSAAGSTSPASSTSTSASGSSSATSTSTTGTPLPTGPTINPGNANYTYLACYTEATAGRALSGKSLAADDMTVPKCLEACAGFRYAGLEYRRECYCGNTFNAGAVVAPSSQCGLTCMGYVFNYCGGGSRLTVYEKRNETASSSSSSSGVGLAAAALMLSDSNSTSTSVTTTSGSSSTSSTSISSSASTSGGSASSASAPNSSSTSSVSSVNATVTSSSSTSTSASTTTSATPTAWSYLGCANQTEPRALNGGRLTSGSMTVTKCQAFCIDRNLTLSGLEAGNECYCGTALQNHSRFGFTGCNTACSGNSSQTCGGSSRLSVYNYTLTEPPVAAHVAAVETYITQGCYTDDALSSFSFTNNTRMTVELCVGACRERNSTYAGLESGEQCHCGTTVASSASRLPDVECDAPCKGNVHEYCGAENKLSLYMNQPSNITTAGLPGLVDDITE